MSGRLAVISDIHGNHRGLLAVLADIAEENCDGIVCLGDLVEGGTSALSAAAGAVTK